MKFNITDFPDSGGIVQIQVDRQNGVLSWDFPLGSPYDLCAIFDRQDGKSLRELQLAGARPILYHRWLKTSCHFSKDRYQEGFLLFPAWIQEGKITIGDQTNGQNAVISADTTQLVVSKVWSWKSLFRRKTVRSIETISLKESDHIERIGDGVPVIFYRIESGNGKRSFPYPIPVSAGEVQILLNRGEDIRFYMDRSFTHLLGSGGGVK